MSKIIGGPYLLPAPRKGRPNRKESFWEVECDYCHKTRLLRKNDMKDQPCRTCAAILRELDKVAVDPNVLSSEVELQFADYLDRMGVPYERQVPLFKYGVILDFKVLSPNGDVYVEFGGYWHKQTKSDKDQVLEDSDLCVLFVNTEDI